MLVEALNSVFDVFAETEHNALISELQMLDKLLSVQAFLAQMVQSDKQDNDSQTKWIEGTRTFFGGIGRWFEEQARGNTAQSFKFYRL